MIFVQLRAAFSAYHIRECDLVAARAEEVQGASDSHDVVQNTLTFLHSAVTVIRKYSYMKAYLLQWLNVKKRHTLTVRSHPRFKTARQRTLPRAPPHQPQAPIAATTTHSYQHSNDKRHINIRT